MLKRYSNADFPLLQTWITDADLLLQFSGTDFTFPLTQQQITDYEIAHPDRQFYIGYDINGDAYAFGEIIPQENGIPRLGRILVGNAKLRGKGLGKLFIKALVKECHHRFSTECVELFVWNKNLHAIKCYQSVGFIYLPEKILTLVHDEISYDIHKMTYTTENDSKYLAF